MTTITLMQKYEFRNDLGWNFRTGLASELPGVKIIVRKNKNKFWHHQNSKYTIFLLLLAVFTYLRRCFHIFVSVLEYQVSVEFFLHIHPGRTTFIGTWCDYSFLRIHNRCCLIFLILGHQIDRTRPRTCYFGRRSHLLVEPWRQWV